MPIDYYGAHSIVFIHSQTFAFDDIVPSPSEKNYYHSWLDFHMVPAVRPHIETPEAEIIMYSDTVSSKVFDLTNARLGFQKFSSLKGQWEFIIDHDRWTDWVTAKAEIEDYFNGRRIMCALMDDPTVAYFGRAFLSNWDDGEDYSRVTIYYDFNYESKLINIDFLNPESITATLRSDAPTFILGDTWKKVKPYISVIATYANGRQSEVEFDFSGGDEDSRLMNIGTNIIKIKHRGHTADIYVNAVEGTVASISHIWKSVQSSIFNLGDYKNSITNRIDLTVTYTNGYSRLIDGTNADYIGGRFEDLSQTSQTITYKGKLTNAGIMVVEGDIASLSYKWKSGQNATFILGNYKDSIRDRIDLNVVYTNGYSRNIDGSNASYISGRFEDLSQTSQSITYKGKSTSPNITVIEGTVASISHTWKSGQSSTFNLGDYKDSIRDRINLNVTYTNGYSRTIDGTNADTISGRFTTLTDSIKQALAYKGKTTDTTISVVEGTVASLSYKWKSGQSSTFNLGDYKDSIRNRINLNITYTNGYSRTIDGTNADYISGRFEDLSQTTQAISYKGQTGNVQVKVYEGAPISITASYKTSPPHQFVVGQSKDSIRQYINITITYNNDSSYSRTIDGSNAQFISGTFSAIGIEPITIIYTNSSGSKSTTINATVVGRQISSISANYKTGENSVFAINDSKDLLRQRINIIVTYNDGTSETINGTNADQITGTFSTDGTQSVTISYNGKTTNINATVVIPVIYHFSVDSNGNTTITEVSQITSNDTARITYGENYNVIVHNGTVGTLTYGFSVNDNGDIIVGNVITGADSVTINNGNTFDLAIVVMH